MISLMTFFLVVVTCQCFTTFNPMKMSMILVFLSVMSLTIAMWFTSSTWYALTIFMLFAGGILVMFMVLSSLTPNDAMKKIKASIVLTLLTTIIATWMNSLSTKTINSQQEFIKTNMSNHFFIAALTLMIILYFFSFMNILSKNNTSMRSVITTCWKMMIL